MSLFKRNPDPEPEHDVHTVDVGPVTVGPTAAARASDNGRDIDVTFAGWGQGGHAGSLRSVGNGVDRTVAVQWDGDTYTTTIEGGAEEVIAKIDRKSERIAPVVPLGR